MMIWVPLDFSHRELSNEYQYTCMVYTYLHVYMHVHIHTFKSNRSVQHNID